MNKHTRFTSYGCKLAVAALAFCAAGSAMAANTATATATSVVVTPISVTKSADLSFGNIAGGASTGTVTVTPGGTRSFTGGAIAAGGTSTAAKFDVTGSGALTYAIDMTGTAATLTANGGADSMTFAAISDTSASAKTSGTVATGALTAGAQSIFVGGSLSVGINQNAGTYTGSINVAVNYN
jgi:hypothetical protein